MKENQEDVKRIGNGSQFVKPANQAEKGKKGGLS
jgi:hypothetical protein